MAHKLLRQIKNPSKGMFIWLFLFVGGIAAVFLLGGLKKILQGFGLVDTKIDRENNELDLVLTKQENKIKKDAAVAAETAVRKQFEAQKSTKSDAEWQGIANILYQDLKYSALDDNKEDAGYQVCRVQNETDVYKLIQQFGKRWEYFFGIPMAEMTLPEFIVSNLSREKLDVINDNYRRKNIKYRF